MSKNSIGFIVSVVLLFAGYSYLAQRHATPPEAANTDAGAQTSPEKSPDKAPQAAQGMPPAVEPIAPDFDPLLGRSSASLTTDDITLDVTQKGGCLEKVVLNQYATKPGGAEPVRLIDKLEPCKALGFKLNDTDLRESPALVDMPSPQRLVMEQRHEGLHLRRTLELSSDGRYQGRLIIELHNVSTQPSKGLLEFEIGATSAQAGSGGIFSFDQSALRHLAYYADETLNEVLLPFEETPSAEVLKLLPDTKVSWVASGGTYFMLGLVPKFSSALGLRFERQPFNMQPNRQSPPERTIYEGWVQHSYELPPSSHVTWDYDVYMGPKDLKDLKAAGHELDEAINYGFFRIVAWPMFQLLSWIEGLVGNWGAAIVVLTLLIRIVFFPLTAKSYVAGKKMQKLQPQLTELREKFKDDKAKQQQELMALMSKEGVNPLGGCLPILPQIPVFFGLNAVLMHTFELRQAPFGLWIQDLATHDPYYVSPVIMAVLMYLQQRMIPMPSMDPTQAKMMRFLPLIFALFMITYPSGLVVYIITSTVFSIAQQQFMMKTFKET